MPKKDNHPLDASFILVYDFFLAPEQVICTILHSIKNILNVCTNCLIFCFALYSLGNSNFH